MNIASEIKTVGIIGAGVAGLAAARLLTEAGYQCEIFEKGDRVGGVWTAGYHSFGLQTPYTLYEIPDYPMPDDYPRLPSGAQLQAYFQDYAEDFDLLDKIHFNVSAEQLSEIENAGWRIRYRQLNSQANLETTVDFVVIATGLYSTPFIPELPGREQFRGDILHSGQYNNTDVVKNKNIVVVGFGKSALDIATDAVDSAENVTLLFRQAHWPIPVDVLNLIDVRRIFLNRLVLGFLPLYQRPGRYAKNLHRYAGWLVKFFWRFVERLLRIQFPLKATGTLPDTVPEHDFFNHAFLPRKDTYRLLRQGKIVAKRGQIAGFDSDAIILENGERLPCDSVIFGTGWKPRFDFLPKAFADSVEADGVYLYRHILHPKLNNMAFIGWASTFSNSLSSHLASFWLVQVLQGAVKLPNPTDMADEIAQMKRWKRRFIPELFGRGSLLQLHMFNFHDELLNDAGINPKRKNNRLAEWLQDYRPKDYRDIFKPK